MPLTPAQAEAAARRALEINPANANQRRTVARTPIGRRGGPRRLVVVVGQKWPASGVRLTVQFLDNPGADLRARFLLHMNAWNKTANVRFAETRATGQVRIARLDSPEDMAGYWSYIGTEILGIEEDQPTLNLEGFTMHTSEAEFRRVVRHEAGHTLGFEHEHMRSALVKLIDRRKAFVYFDRTQGWTAEETKAQVLTPLAAKSIMGTAESDPLSIMCYQIPSEITKGGKAIPGGRDINPKDFAFAGSIYPKRIAAPSAEVEDAPLSPKESGRARGTATLDPADGDTFHLVIMDDSEPVRRDAGRQRKSGEDGGATSAQEAKRPRYVRVFASYGGARVTAAMRLRAEATEQPTHFGSIIRVHERIRNYTNREQGSLPSDVELAAFGEQLFETLFPGDVRRLYDEARSRQRGRKLDFVFTSMIPWIAEKPWEFAYDPGRRSFLATEEIHFVRNVLTAIPADVTPLQAGPLRILVAAAQPIGFGCLSVSQEVEVIRRGFEPLIQAGLVEVEVLARATPSGIHERLSMGNYPIVHFIGHGVFDERTQEGALVFEDSRGGELILGERPLREILCQRGVSLVFLNACQSGSGGRADFNKGVAQALVAHGLPALVANQYSVLDSSATSFAQHFYWSLARGQSVGRAASEARIAVNYGIQGDPIDWAVPVVYARDPNMALRAAPDSQTTLPPTPILAAARRAPKGRSLRVAVWDIDGVFPALQHTLDGMNEAQSVFGFELVDISSPIDAWDLEQRADDGTPYLWAEKLARRLESKTVELRVNVLACITRHWLRDDDWLNLYGWWPDNQKPPVVIFSCAGFEGLAAEGPETNRAIANLTVTGLAGFLGELGSHEQGAKSCPLAFNQNREFDHLTGAQSFDKPCGAKLRKKLPREFPALEALLKAFR